MSAGPSSRARRELLLLEFARLSGAASRNKFLKHHRSLLRAGIVTELAQTVRERVRVDTQQALQLAEAAEAIARKLGQPEPLAQSLRAKANALYALGRNKSAVKLHEQALKLFRAAGNKAEAARTLSASIQPLILLGQYDRAFIAAEQAWQIFAEQGDDRRLARLEINRGNIFHRQDRFEEAEACYERAYQQLLPHKDAEGIAAALSNMAVCLISLNDFPRALANYQQAREFCVQQKMPLLVAQADYNVAYLHYLRGEYSRAIGMLRAARDACQKVGDLYHSALCQLDLSEIYLELNLSAEAAEVAQEAFLRFQELGMGYEVAKALANQAIALSQQEKAFLALELFGKARAMFVNEKNLAWPWLIDLYQALVLFKEGRYFEARRLCLGALEFFRSSVLPAKAVLCQLLLARLALRTGDLEAARRECAGALERLATLVVPMLRYQAHFLMGQVQQAAGNGEGAYESYQSAREALETLRSSLRGEELKIAFIKNKLEVYEALVELCLGQDHGPAAEEAFGYIEQAKSRSLQDLLFHGAQYSLGADPGQSDLVRRIRDLREELNWYHHRIELEQLQQEERSPQRIERLELQAEARENELLRVLRDLPASEPEGAQLRASNAVPLEALRAALAPGAALVEYFQVRDRILAALVTRERLEITPVSLAPRVRGLLRLLQFQLSKFRLGADYQRMFHDSLLEATQAHLRELYQELLAPIRQGWEGKHLIIVPHDVLHYLPFHALYDGREYLIDSCKVSYAPSATIYALCHSQVANTAGSSLILGVPDPQAPFILQEVQSVAAILPQAELYVGDAANLSVLREKGQRSRIVHVAAHGNFRQDNPMFSGIRLGGSYLSLYDLYQLKLPVELVTLSGCATGLNVVAAGDELLGLVRGLLCAGAQSLLLTLWEVHDKSTAEFMSSFYRRFRDSGDKPLALKEAMLELRERYPHPYYWAPFLLMGKVFPT